MRTSQDILRIGATVMLVGFIIILVGIVLTIIQHPASSQMGGLIMLGPIPIVFGSSPEITTNILGLGLGLGLIVSILYLFLWKKR